ncbi:carboxypeptidase regulatory-like domain-containing protein [Pedobacter punctiformis]|uniref:Carboxypeptidase regulatory-like domain-containing protein n=1 Tax=Pedobacter punctiformis TaxID=3004097 RepID=A0ABT4L5U3_9SPHI|nr:carboxypeptidase regulatory-like domain-containing protein [Pedobacter sp. HCMS5-2]MCZ4243308.1 carboxypeptidase regulatory-like domain-containing protein [Pedobacter sp. HCMS5-2]
MKKLSIFLFALILSSLCFIAFTSIKLGGITGRVSPASAVVSVSLISTGTDTLKAQVNDGAFTFSNLKQGVYTVWIKAGTPYKDTVIDNVAVKDSSTTDLGEIKLQQ